MTFRLPVPHPGAPDTRAAREAQAAVDDQKTPVIPIVQAMDGRLDERPEELDPAPGLRQGVTVRGRHREAANGVEEQIGDDTGAAALGQCLDELLRVRPVLVAVLREADGLLGSADGLEHRREQLVAVQENVHPVAADDRRLRVGLEGREERGLPEHQRRQLEMRVRTGTCGEARREEDGERDAPAPARRASRHH